jgi:hypothetical protein
MSSSKFRSLVSAARRVGSTLTAWSQDPAGFERLARGALLAHGIVRKTTIEMLGEEPTADDIEASIHVPEDAPLRPSIEIAAAKAAQRAYIASNRDLKAALAEWRRITRPQAGSPPPTNFISRAVAQNNAAATKPPRRRRSFGL